MYDNQRHALAAAMMILEELPANTIFAVEITDQDTDEDPSVLNIYVDDVPQMIKRLKLTDPVDTSDTYQSFRVGPLLVSINEGGD